MTPETGYLRLLLATVVAGLFAACASIGRPEGGPRDYDPPVYLRSNPSPGQTNVRQNRFDLYFNENLKLEDVMNKVVISPTQIQMPHIVESGKRITVELKDTLIPDATYTIDFSDAIRDLNEGNVLDGFTLDFSTGPSIDTLQISGMLFKADNLEPAQGMLVGVYSDSVFADTTLTKVPFSRVCRTNQLGQFTLRGLKPGSYRIFALNDVNRDNFWNRSEDIAFYDTTITPFAHRIEITDTLSNSWGEDSLVTRRATEFLPNDILLTWFNEGYAAQYLKNYNRIDSTRIYLEFAAPSDSMPELTVVSGNFRGRKIDASCSVLDASLTRDTLTYWLTDPDMISADSLLVAARYLKTDSTDNLSWTTDTLQFNFKRIRPKKDKKKDKEEQADSVPPVKLIKFDLTSPQNVDIYAPLRFTSSEPLKDIDYGGIHLEIEEDSVWYPVEITKLAEDTLNSPLSFKLPVKWEEGAHYRVTVDSMAVAGIYGGINRPVSSDFTVKTNEDYAALFFTINDPDADKMVIQLLNSKDEPVRTTAVRGNLASFLYLEPGTYYARGFIDSDGDGKWTTGEIASSRQPETVFYYPKRITLNKNWDIEQTWSPFEINLDIQKPEEIKQNKPKKSGPDANRDNETRDGEEEEEDEWETFGQPGSQYNDRHRNNAGGNFRRNSTF